MEGPGPQLFVQVLHHSVLNVLWVNIHLSLALFPYRLVFHAMLERGPQFRGQVRASTVMPGLGLPFSDL